MNANRTSSHTAPYDSGQPPTIIAMKIAHSHTRARPPLTPTSSPRKRGPRPPSPQPTNPSLPKQLPTFIYIRGQHPTVIATKIAHSHTLHGHSVIPASPSYPPPLVIPAKAGTQAPVSITHQPVIAMKIAFEQLTGLPEILSGWGGAIGRRSPASIHIRGHRPYAIPAKGGIQRALGNNGQSRIHPPSAATLAKAG